MRPRNLRRRNRFLFFILLSAILLSITEIHGACPATGSGIVVNGTTDAETLCTISTTSPNVDGTNVTLGGTINLSNSTITTSGTNARGAHSVGSGSTINLTDVSISTQACALIFNS